MPTFEERRSRTERRREVTHGTGSPLTQEEIIRANKIHACETCGIIHVGRECRPQERYDEPRSAIRGRKRIR